MTTTARAVNHGFPAAPCSHDSEPWRWWGVMGETVVPARISCRLWVDSSAGHKTHHAGSQNRTRGSIQATTTSTATVTATTRAATTTTTP